MLKDKWESLDKKEAKEILVNLIRDEKINYRNPFYTGYEPINIKRINYLQNKKQLSEDDVFKRSTLVFEFEEITEESRKIEIPERIEHYIDCELEQGLALLYGLYGDGQDQCFMHDDGIIDECFYIERENGYINVYAYYEYIGK